MITRIICSTVSPEERERELWGLIQNNLKWKFDEVVMHLNYSTKQEPMSWLFDSGILKKKIAEISE